VALLSGLCQDFVVEIIDQWSESLLALIQLYNFDYVVLFERSINTKVVYNQLNGQNTPHLEIVLHIIHELIN